ncbi:MAG: proline dehydrogenase family protein [Planctomycetes bacterium]|jgi:proline dehydrogenase|nr:proline dehydrogenase family protein [Planctomycetota bacterium]
MRILDRLIARSLPVFPRFLVRWVASQYIAGEDPAAALDTVERLSRHGARATLDLLGEEVTESGQAREIAQGYREVLSAIGGRNLPSGVSVKLSGLGVRRDPELARGLLGEIVAAAREVRRFVRIDMEDSTLTDTTLSIYRGLREDGFANVGIVLQACLRRTLEDAASLADLRPDVRVVKGIYVEPEAISLRDPEAIRESYVRLLDFLVDKGCRAAAATHDGKLIFATKEIMRRRGITPGGLEFQMLLGVRERLRDALLAAGQRVRIYVPFGKLWYEYSLRRLRENPAVAGHVTRQLFGRIFGFGRRSR